jgi:hypothetical protein
VAGALRLIVDTYLKIAEDILRQTRRPMSALQILRAAYAKGIAPAHLFGRTQHKTLQARLSEDILNARDQSRFYRTAPGRFLLRDLMDDASIAPEERQPIVARRRKRDLPHRRALAFTSAEVRAAVGNNTTVEPSGVLELIERGSYHYAKTSKIRCEDDVLVWSFVIVMRDTEILTYRRGAYREDRDNFLLKRTLGFYSPIVETDRDLFDQEDHGIVSSGLRALATDLDIAYTDVVKLLIGNTVLQSFVLPQLNNSGDDLLALVSFNCPEWFEPTTRRLAINDLEWMDLRSMPNHHEDFDPWSQAILTEARRIALNPLP